MCSNEHTTETSLLLHIIQCKNRGDQFSRKKAQTFVLLQKTSSNIYLNVHFQKEKKELHTSKEKTTTGFSFNYYNDEQISKNMPNFKLQNYSKYFKHHVISIAK